MLRIAVREEGENAQYCAAYVVRVVTTPEVVQASSVSNG